MFAPNSRDFSNQLKDIPVQLTQIFLVFRHMHAVVTIISGNEHAGDALSGKGS
ncbi:hypothetical protein CDL15_Pgr012462 [Punica granatum]|uniref:Uncharacterized protein n=1 Tax=Punica granatum TaxID=22663 RepID=A0A218WZH1_PUNGR|nr:hypothetical protein CDL15_Pgr012462 [Punica granatum]